jgi:hypothetical protein
MRTILSCALLSAALVACADVAPEASASAAAPLGPFAATCGYDPAGPTTLADITAKPIANDADAQVRFSCLQQILIDRHDRRAPFATLYSMTTDNVIAAIAAGHFQDGPWVAAYLAEFAELYRVAFHAYEVGDRASVPEAWRIAFDTAAGKKELVVQDLALGVNAHVDRDLAYALVAVGIGTTSSQRASRYADHTAVNDVLHAELSGAMQKIAVLYAPGFGKAPAEVMTILETVFFGALVTGREVAWQHAVQLTDDPTWLRPLVQTSIEVGATGLAGAVLAPSLSPTLIAVLRGLEGS